MTSDSNLISAKVQYRRYCSTNHEVPLFLQAWWLDADCCPEHWDVVVIGSDTGLEAYLPYCITKRWGFRGIGMPVMTKYMGHKLSGVQEANPIGEDELILELFRKLPEMSFCYLQLFPGQIFPASLHQLAYKTKRRLTCILPDIRNLDIVFKAFEGRARTAIRKAENLVRITKEKDPGILFQVMESTYRKQGKANYYSPEHFRKVLSASFDKGKGHLYVARDSQNNVHASAFTVWDKHTCYNLVQGSVPEYLESNAISMIIWEAIQDASINGLTRFDFTGSMIPGVQKFLRSFGAVPTPYYAISKENSLPFKLLMKLKEVKDWGRGR